MLLAYTRVGQPENAEKLLKEIREEHSMEPDVVCVTTVIDGYYKQGNISKCWELYEECRHRSKPGLELDEQLLSYMIKVCSRTKEAEKGIRLFNELEIDGFVEYSKPFNSIMMACASRKEYAPKAIEYWHLMHMKNIEPDNVTFVAVLKACAMLGDIQTAFDVLQELKRKGGIMNENVFN